MQKKLAVMVFLSIAAASHVWAQASGGQSGISGTVKDSSGAVVPGAKVVISTASQGEVRSITTNTAGVFSAPALLPGPGYKVAVTASGFAPYELKDIDLQVGQNVNVTIDMSVGQTATSVEVVAAAEVL